MMNGIEDEHAGPLAARWQAIAEGASKSEVMLAQWLMRNEAALGLETGASIAAKTGVSEITVSRFLKRLGYRGLAALKQELMLSGAAQLAPADSWLRLLDGEIGSLIKRDAEAVLALSAEVSKPEWIEAIAAIGAAPQVHVTGFQTVRGVAEDFCRRLSILRDDVHFLSAHDSGLAEWIRRKDASGLFFLVDTVPYAREAEPMVKAAAERGMAIVVATDELNTWAAAHTPYVFHVPSKIGTFVESTGPLASLLNLVIHAVAALDAEDSRRRMKDWDALLKRLNLFR
jgi:DNA-binding MurR/RpiR family transcriptional regulator